MKAKSEKKENQNLPENRMMNQPAGRNEPEKDDNQLSPDEPVKKAVAPLPESETFRTRASRRLRLSKKVSDILIQQLPESERAVVPESERAGLPEQPFRLPAPVKKFGVKHRLMIVAGCMLAMMCMYIWPTLGIERYLTRQQCERLERLVASKDYKNGLQFLSEIREGREGDYQYWMYLGVCNAGIADNSLEAEQNFLKALSLSKEQYEIYEVKYYLASMFNDLGRYDETRVICLEALARVRKWKPGARERYEALLNRSDVNKENQKLQEAGQRGDWLKEDVADTTNVIPVIIPLAEDSLLLAMKKDSIPENEDLSALEASAREMLEGMGDKGKNVKDIIDLLPDYDKKAAQQKKGVLPPAPKAKKETEAERVSWIRDMKIVIGKDTLIIIQGSDSLVAVVKRIAKVMKEPDGGLVYVIPDDELVEADGLEKLLDKNVTVMIYEVFDFNKVNMNGRGHLFMNKLNSLLDGRPDIQLNIAVHCDGIGTREINMRVAQMRMVGIRDRLEKKDIPAGRIHFEICGSDNPRQVTSREAAIYSFLKVGDVLTMGFLRTLTPEQRRIGHMLNRRVEIRKNI